MIYYVCTRCNEAHTLADTDDVFLYGNHLPYAETAGVFVRQPVQFPLSRKVESICENYSGHGEHGE